MLLWTRASCYFWTGESKNGRTTCDSAGPTDRPATARLRPAFLNFFSKSHFRLGGAPIQENSAVKGGTPGSGGDAAVCTRALTRRFGNLVAVDRVSLGILPGEIFGLIGPNGAGKSTLIKMLTTLLPPSSGAAWVAGFDIITEASEVRRNIGYVPQMLSADGALTGYENMLVSARLYTIPRREREQRIAEALATVNLTRDAQRPAQQYSGGMIRRLEIAQSMLHRPKILVMDEPTVGLDPVARRAVWDDIRMLRETRGMTILITTHDMEEADGLCDRIALMHHGRIEIIDAPAELKRQVGPEATLDDVFAHYTGLDLEADGGYRQARQARRSARQHG
jgi:ABC-2 type transport system ATP-binding protein